MKARSLVLAFALALAACAGGAQNPGNMQVRTTSAVISSMSGHKTYAYQAEAPPPEGDVQWAGAQAAIAEIKEHIDAQMQAKGYVLSPNPEMMIRISLGVRTVRHDPKGSLAVAGAPSDYDTQQDLAIDVFDFSNGGHLFHGTASNPLHHREPGENKLAKAVRLILEPVPPASS